MVARTLTLFVVLLLAACSTPEPANGDGGLDDTGSQTESESESLTESEIVTETDSDSTSETSTEINTDVDTSCDGVVQIPDMSFRYAIINSLECDPDIDLTGEVLADVTRLEASYFNGNPEEDCEIESIIGAQCMPNLDFVYFECVSFSDLTPLKNLQNLRTVVLSINLVTDFSPLAGHPTLTKLHSIGGQLTNAFSLSGITSLEELDLSGNDQLDDLTGLSTLENLQSLDISATPVSDLSALSSLTQLKVLDLYYTDVADLTPLSGLTNIEVVDITNTEIANLSPLESATKLKVLTAAGTRIASLEPLANAASLELIYVSSGYLDEISGLASKPNLKEATLCCEVSDISALADAESLEYLNVTENDISDLSPLSQGLSLEYIDFSGNQVSDLSPLINLPNLKTVWALENPIDCVEQADNIAALLENGVDLHFDCL